MVSGPLMSTTGFSTHFSTRTKPWRWDKYTLVDASGLRTVYNWLQYFTKDTLAEEFRKVGLKIEAFYSDVWGTPYDENGTEFAVVARKAAT